MRLTLVFMMGGDGGEVNATVSARSEGGRRIELEGAIGTASLGSKETVYPTSELRLRHLYAGPNVAAVRETVATGKNIVKESRAYKELEAAGRRPAVEVFVVPSHPGAPAEVLTTVTATGKGGREIVLQGTIGVASEGSARMIYPTSELRLSPVHAN